MSENLIERSIVQFPSWKCNVKSELRCSCKCRGPQLTHLLLLICRAAKWFPHPIQSLCAIKDKMFTLRALVLSDFPCLLLWEGSYNCKSLAGIHRDHSKGAQRDLLYIPHLQSNLPCLCLCLWLKCTWECEHSFNSSYNALSTVLGLLYRSIYLIITEKLWSTSTSLILQTRKLRHREAKSLAQGYTHSKRELGYTRQYGTRTCAPGSWPYTSRLAILAAEWKFLLATNSWIYAFTAPPLKNHECSSSDM